MANQRVPELPNHDATLLPADICYSIDVSSTAPTYPDGEPKHNTWQGVMDALNFAQDVAGTVPAPTLGDAANFLRGDGTWAAGGGGGPGSDTTAIHVDTANEINAITAKATPAAGDHLVIEDSEAAGVKKSITIGNLPGGGGGLDGETVSNNTILGNSTGTGLASSNNVVIGASIAATFSGGNHVLVGQDAGDALTTASDNVCIGFRAGNLWNTGAGNVAIGNQCGHPSGGTANSVCIGKTSKASGGSIAIGESADASLLNIFVAGSGTSRVNTVYFGKGVSNSAPTLYTIKGTANSTTNGNGGDIALEGGDPDGSGTRGNILLANLPTSDPAVAGAVWNNAGVLNISAG